MFTVWLYSSGKLILYISQSNHLHSPTVFTIVFCDPIHVPELSIKSHTHCTPIVIPLGIDFTRHVFGQVFKMSEFMVLLEKVQ